MNFFDKRNRKKRNQVILGVSLILIVILVLLAKFRVINNYMQTVIMFICVNMIMSSSLNIINGYMGEFSCGHAGFMAVGAYASSTLSLLFFTDGGIGGTALFSPGVAVVLFPVVILAGGVVAAFAGLIVAIPSFKTRDDYLAIITIAANYIIMTGLNNIEGVGASRGLMGMKNTLFAMSDVINLPWIMIWVLLFTVLSIILISHLMSSTLGKGITAIRFDEISAELMSVNTNRMKVIAFMFSSGLAGIAGGLFAHIMGFINPASFNILKSTESLVMVYLGGMGSLSGSIIAAVLFSFLTELLRPLQIFKWVLIPLLLILIMQFRPSGLLGGRELSEIIFDFLEKRKKKGLLKNENKGAA